MPTQTATIDPALLAVVVGAASAAGCPQDQPERFLRAGYVPQPRQFDFHALARSCDDIGGPTQVHMGGTRAGAKTHTLFAQACIDDLRRVDGLNALFLRHIKKAAAESFADLAAKILRHVPHKFSREQITFPNGSKLVIGGFKDETDVDKYVGVEYDILVGEEWTQLSAEKQDMVMGSLRTSRTDWRPRLYASWNPGGRGYPHVKRLVVQPWRDGTEKHTRFIYSKYSDNKFINPEYVTWLEGLTGYLKKVWADGDLDIAEGLAFPTFTQDTHVIPAQEIPDHWPRWRAVDYGYSPDPFSCHWYARDLSLGRIHVYREAYEWMLTDTQQARKIVEMTLPDERIITTYGGHDMFTTKVLAGKVSCNADEYRKNGVPLTMGDNRRIQGKRKVERLLAPLLDGKPGLVIHDCCPHMIEQLESLVTKEGKEDIEDGQEDHAYDDLRYALTNYEAYKEPQSDIQKPLFSKEFKQAIAELL